MNREQLLLDTIKYRDDNYHSEDELIEIANFIQVIKSNDERAIKDYTQFGSEPHKILLNKRVYQNAVKCGFEGFEFSEYGWIESNQYQIEVVEEIGFLAPKEKEPNNYFEIGKTPNGKYLYSCYYKTGAAGGSSSLHIFHDLYDSKEQCINHALNLFKTKFEEAIESAKTDENGNYKMPYCKQILASINKHFEMIQNFSKQILF